ncbi:MAG TPA: alternative ribosome rescue aminoacyl-tRNA hydrolase ArfB [Anaerolineae bacterium]|jgi:ribosome-associated protein|nr:alternative ribosome rescue aminoacyl-tRNA hydrolase ArfB [Anaerolineae bacterium]
MTNEDVLPITPNLAIPLSELDVQFTRSSGPGGQHVNRSATRVELRFDIALSPSLTEEQRQRLLERLAGRLDGDGVLRVVAQSERSQLRNRQEALQRLQEALRQALHVPKKRRRSKVPRKAKERRLAEKRRRAQAKRDRQQVGADGE